MIKELYKKNKETAHNFFWRALQIFSKQGVSFIIFYIATAYLTKETFGFYTYLLAILSLFMIFCDFGISTATSKYVAEYGTTNPKKVNKLTYTSAVITISAGLIVTALLLAFGKYLLGDAYPTILYFIPCLFLIPLSSVLDGIYRGKKEFKKLSVISISSGVIALVFALILIPKYGLIGAIITQNILYLMLATIAFVFVSDKVYKIDRTALKKIMKYSAIIGVVSMMGFLYTRVDVIVLKHFGYLVEIGYYEIANRIFALLLLPFMIYGQVIAPNITKKYALKKFEYVRKNFMNHVWICISIGVVTSVVLFFVAPWMISVFFSKYFTQESLLIFELLLLTLPLKMAAAVIGQGHTNATGNADISMWTMIPAGIANLVLDIIFISKYGFIGVVYSTLIVYTFANLSLIIIYNLKLKRMVTYQ